MQYALIGDQRSEARKGAIGKCPDCGARMVAKCGTRVIHHWAHASRRNCDPWWENETEWHRVWKGAFPEKCREVSHTAPDGEIHRADIKTPTGIVIEIQHSSMPDNERESRESFYKNLIWIVDGESFRRNFHIGCMLPDPGVKLFHDIVWFQLYRSAYRWSKIPLEEEVPDFWRISETAEYYPGITKSNERKKLPPGALVEFHSGDEIAKEVRANYIGHHQFYWTRPRQTWLEAKCPVYIDFGEEVLYRLETYDETGAKCIRIIAKRKLIHDAVVEKRAEDIATRFYPIN